MSMKATTHSTSDSTVSPLRMYRPFWLTPALYHATCKSRLPRPRRLKIEKRRLKKKTSSDSLSGVSPPTHRKELSMSLQDKLREYVAAAFTGLWIQSYEHEDALREIAQLCRDQ